MVSTRTPTKPIILLDQTNLKSVNSVNNNVKRKTRRSNRNKHLKNKNSKNFVVIGTNCNGILSKQESLQNNINIFAPAVQFFQETKLSRKGQIKLPNYQVFESIRSDKEGGGLLTAAHIYTEPVLVSDYQESGHEILVIQAKFGNNKMCRFINAYGPQESVSLENRNNNIEFYSILDQEVKNAEFLGHLICIQMDSNAKLGPEFIKGDPHSISGNGQLLSDVIVGNNLIVCNGTPKCEGTITRERQTIDRLEQSIIDFLIVCPNMFSSLQSMKIDDNNKMKRYIRRKNNITIIQSDHKLIVGVFNQCLRNNLNNPEKRLNIFNFRDNEGWVKYKRLTSMDTLSKCFKSGNFQEEARIWLKKFHNILCRSFPVIRVQKKI